MARVLPELLDSSRYRWSCEISTRFADVDPNQHINNVAMAAAFEDARVRYDGLSGLRERYAFARTMIAAAHIDYLAEAHYPAPLTVHVGIVEIGRSSWTMGELAMQGARVCAYCKAIMVATDGTRAMRLPDDLRAQLEANMLKAKGS